jgi:hypothetical protein
MPKSLSLVLDRDYDSNNSYDDDSRFLSLTHSFCVTDQNVVGNHLKMVVKKKLLLGIPSPASLQKRSRTRDTSTTPLFQTTVLLQNDTPPPPTTTTTPRDGSTREELHHQDPSRNENGYHGNNDNEEDADYEQDIFNFRRGISPSTTPVQIILSRDSSIGVAQILPTATMPPSWWRVSSTI